MAELDGLIDSKISLITHNDEKYDGILFSINAAESSMVLKEVRCLGTEDRVSDPAKRVPPSDEIVAFVTFPGQDIKDLIVHDSVSDTSPPAPPTPPAATATKTKSSTNKPPPPPPNNNNNRQQRGRGGGGQGGGGRGSSGNNSSSTGGRGSNVGTGAHLLHLRERKTNDTSDSAAGAANTKEEFDFQAGLNVFKKEDVLAKVATEKTDLVVSEETKYKKDDFFDCLSCDLVDRQAGVHTRLTASEERNLNQDTFGAIALQSNNYRRYYRGGGGGGRGEGRGRGRGGRGRGRGRGRGGGGGYNNNSSVPPSSYAAAAKA